MRVVRCGWLLGLALGCLTSTLSAQSLKDVALPKASRRTPTSDGIKGDAEPSKPTRSPASTSTEAMANRSTASDYERQVVAEMSLARTQPKRYATYLRALRPYFNGTRFEEPGKVTMLTNEGVRALDEAIAFLEAAEPQGPLAWSESLYLAARDHAMDQSRSGATGHSGSDGSSMSQRIERYGTWSGTCAENINYNDGDPRRTVIDLLVDDGVASRGHRRNIFNAALQVAGAAKASHRVYRMVCVIDYATAVKPKDGR